MGQGLYVFLYQIGCLKPDDGVLFKLIWHVETESECLPLA